MKRWTAIIPLILLSLAWTGCNDDEPIIDEALLGVTWMAGSIRSPRKLAIIEGDSIWIDTFVNGSVATSTKYVPISGWFGVIIRFDREMEIRAQICNIGQFRYEIEQMGIILIVGWGWTEEGCHTSTPNLEDLLTSVLDNVTRYEVAGDQLELRSQDGSYSAVFTAK